MNVLKVSAPRKRRHRREIDFRPRHVVEIVRKEIEHDIGDNLGNLPIAEPDLTQSGEIFVMHPSAFGHEFASKLEGFGWYCQLNENSTLSTQFAWT